MKGKKKGSGRKKRGERKEDRSGGARKKKDGRARLGRKEKKGVTMATGYPELSQSNFLFFFQPMFLDGGWSE